MDLTLNEKRYRCKCVLCRRTRKFYRLTANLPPKNRAWMRGFYDSVLDTECELEMRIHCEKT